MSVYVDECPYCGAPLTDVAGYSCPRCHIPLGPPAPDPGGESPAGFVGPRVPPRAGPDLRGGAPPYFASPLDTVLTVLLGLSREPGMAPFCSSAERARAMQQVVDGVWTAGDRIRHLPGRIDPFGWVNPKLLTSEEIWFISLCADVGKEIARAEGTDPFPARFADDAARQVRSHFGRHALRKARRRVRPPTEELGRLRRAVPPTA